jgi:small subunit ribosomal protein S16
MATRIRLRRMGSKKRPFYRVVVADQRAPREGRFIEIIGKYHPLSDPSVIEIDEERALHWLRVGAQPSNQVRNLMTKIGIWERFVAERPSAGATSKGPKPERPAKEKLSKKAQAKAAAGAAEAAPAAEKEDVPVQPEVAAPEADASEITEITEAAQPEAEPEAQPEPEAEAEATEESSEG